MGRWWRWLPLIAVLVFSVVAFRSYLSNPDGGQTNGSLPQPADPAVTSTSSLAASTTTTTTLVTSAALASNADPAAPDAETVNPAESSSPYGGVAVVGVIGSAEGLNPYLIDSPFVDAIGAVTWASAFVLHGASYEVQPGVLAELPSLANGGLVPLEDGAVRVTMRIADGARWADGIPISGADFAFTVQMVVNERSALPEVRALYSLVEDPEASARSFSFTLAEPTIAYLDLFQAVLPRHQMVDTDLSSDWADGGWLSAGPYVVEGDVSDTEVQLVRNPLFWKVDADGRSLPYLDELVVVGFDSAEAVVTALRQQQISGGELGVQGVLVDGVEHVARTTATGEEWEHVGFQFGNGRFAANPRSNVDSPAFRMSIADLVGDDALVAEIGADELIPTSSVVAPAWPGASSLVVGGGPDESGTPDADALATADGSPSLTYATTTALDRSQMAGIVLREMAARGVAVAVELDDPGLFFRDAVIAGEFEVAEWAWTVTPGPVGAVADIQDRFATSAERGGFDFYRWSDSEGVEDLVARIEALHTYVDIEELRVELAAIDAALLDLHVVVPLWQTTISAAHDIRRVEGLAQPKFGVPLTWNAALWLIPGGCDDVDDGAVCGGVILPSSAG